MKRSRDPRTIVAEHNSWRARCLNLIPSENVMSEAARSLLSCDMGQRYTLPGIEEMDGRLVENAYRGTRYLDEIEAYAVELACRVFRCRYACVRPISGHISAVIALASICKRGDLIIAQGFAHGGYPGYQSDEMAGMLGLRSIPLPFEEEEWDIRYGEARQSMLSSRPRAVGLGASKIMFPPILAVVTGTGSFLIPNGTSSSSICTSPPSTLYCFIFEVMSADSADIAEASIRFPSWSRT